MKNRSGLSIEMNTRLLLTSLLFLASAISAGSALADDAEPAAAYTPHRLAPGSMPIAPPAAKAGAKPDINPSKCLDPAKAQASLANAIISKERAARNGVKPAISYEDSDTFSESAQSVDARTTKSAAKLASGLFAAMANPKNPASAASQVLMSDANRRSSLHMFQSCTGQMGAPSQIIDNSNYDEKGANCPDGNLPISVGINTNAVYQTNRDPMSTVEAIVRSKLTDDGGDKKSICVGAAPCADSARYHATNPAAFTPPMNKDFSVQTSTSVAMLWKMEYRESMRVQPIDICGGKAYLISANMISNKLTFDRSTRLTLVAKVGGKTIVLDDAASQVYTEGSFALRAPGHFQETEEGAFGKYDASSQSLTGGYANIATAIGSTERPNLGEVQGDPGQPISGQNVAHRAARGSVVTQ